MYLGVGVGAGVMRGLGVGIGGSPEESRGDMCMGTCIFEDSVSVAALCMRATPLLRRPGLGLGLGLKLGIKRGVGVGVRVRVDPEFVSVALYRIK